MAHGNADSASVKDLGKPCDQEGHARIDERGLETEVRPDEATFIQKVKFLLRQVGLSRRSVEIGEIDMCLDRIGVERQGASESGAQRSVSMW